MLSVIHYINEKVTNVGSSLVSLFCAYGIIMVFLSQAIYLFIFFNYIATCKLFLLKYNTSIVFLFAILI